MKRSLTIVAALVTAPLFAASANAAPQANDSWRNFTVLGVLGVTLGAYHTNEEGKQVVNPRAPAVALVTSAAEGLAAVRAALPAGLSARTELPARVPGALAGDAYVYFVLLTSKSEKEALTEGLTEGADDFLSKPVNADELRARILAADRIISTDRLLHDRNRDLANVNAQLARVNDALERDLIEARRLQQALDLRHQRRQDRVQERRGQGRRRQQGDPGIP